jgi:CheY-like chemotaxis protein/two-component sensor histidine kinase
VELLLDEDAGVLTEEQCDFLGIVKKNADRLVSLVNDLLDVSRIESGRVELNREPMDVSDSIEQVVELMRPQIERKNQQIYVRVAGDLATVNGDPRRVVQVLTNLLSNAQKYTPDGGLIEITASNQGAFVRIDVKDDGIGMSAEDQAKLFQKFFRARNDATEAAGGTGLGLVITRSLVELHGGRIDVSTAPGQGTTFSVTLPATSESVQDRLAAPGRQPGGRILVIEDDPDIANLIGRYLNRAGYTVMIARSAEEALRLAQAEPPDLITLDLVLPDADGFTLLERLRSEASLLGIPTIVVSTVPDSGRGAALGVQAYISKPVQENILLDRIVEILSNRAVGGAPVVTGSVPIDSRSLAAS